MHFNIILSNHHQTAYFAMSQTVTYLRNALSTCGHDVTISMSELHRGAMNVFIENFEAGVEGLVAEIEEHRKSIPLRVGVVSTELMVDGTIPYAQSGLYRNDPDQVRNRVAGFEYFARHADFVWHLVERTAVNFNGINRNQAVFPYGHVEGPSARLRRSPKDLDVVFFGRMTPHRRAVIDSLRARNIAVVDVGYLGAGWVPDFVLSSLLDRAKIGLNLTLHSLDDTPIAGVDPRFASCARIVEMLERDVCVVSEEIPLDNPYRNHMVSAPVSQLADVCRSLLDSGEWQTLGPAAAARFRREMDAIVVCGPVIARTCGGLDPNG
ncbi:MAG: hypothetical protein H7840_05630 [Alphaproteobacteria bacterium]